MANLASKNQAAIEIKKVSFDTFETNATEKSGQSDFSSPVAVTEMTVDEAVAGYSLEVSPPERLSSVTRAKLEQIERINSIITSRLESDELEVDICGGMPEIEGTDAESDRHIPEACINPTPVASNEAVQIPLALAKPLTNGKTNGLSQTLLESWLNRIATVSCAEDCMNCLEALNSLPTTTVEQIWSSAETLLAIFWSVAESETSSDCNEYQSGDSRHHEGNNSSIKEDFQSAAENLATPTISDELSG